jgi:hypothetical protein
VKMTPRQREQVIDVVLLVGGAIAMIILLFALWVILTTIGEVI